MTEMLEVSPLSPVREWAIARSRCGISALHHVDGGPDEVFGQQGRANAQDLARGLRHPAATLVHRSSGRACSGRLAWGLALDHSGRPPCHSRAMPTAGVTFPS